MNSTPKSCTSCTNSFCQILSPESRAKIFSARRWVTYDNKNEQLIFFGDEHLFILESGALMTIRSVDGGRKQGIDILKAGDLLGIVQLFNDGYENSISVQPLSPVSGCMLPIKVMEQLIQVNPDIAVAVIAQFSRRILRVINHFSVDSLGTSKDKLDYALCATTDSDIKQLTHEKLAILSGLNRVTVTRTIRRTTKESIDKYDK